MEQKLAFLSLTRLTLRFVEMAYFEVSSQLLALKSPTPYVHLVFYGIIIFRAFPS